MALLMEVILIIWAERHEKNLSAGVSKHRDCSIDTQDWHLTRVKGESSRKAQPQKYSGPPLRYGDFHFIKVNQVAFGKCLRPTGRWSGLAQIH